MTKRYSKANWSDADLKKIWSALKKESGSSTRKMSTARNRMKSIEAADASGRQEIRKKFGMSL